MEWLKGKKQYLMALGIAVVTFMWSMNWISNEVYVALMGLLGAGTVAANRAAIAKTKE